MDSVDLDSWTPRKVWRPTRRGSAIPPAVPPRCHARLAMSAIQSPAAPPARPPLRRSTTAAASPLRGPSQPQPAPPSIASRRTALVALVLAAAAPARPAAAAFSLGIRTTASLASLTNFYRLSLVFSLSPVRLFLFVLARAAGPKELLREQKKKSASYLLAPIAASRDTLVKSQALLGNSMSSEAFNLPNLVGRPGNS